MCFLQVTRSHVMDVFAVITFDYISKPITAEKLESVLLKAMQYLNLIKQDFGLMSIFWTQKVKLFYAALLANNSH